MRLTANSQRGLRKGQKQGGQLVFSQLICQSGPQTSEHITVFLPDKSGWRGGRGRGGRWGCCHGLWLLPYTRAHTHSHPSHPPLGKRTQMAQDSSSGCHSSRVDVTRSLRCKGGVGALLFKYPFFFFLIYVFLCISEVFLIVLICLYLGILALRLCSVSHKKTLFPFHTSLFALHIYRF